MLGNSCDGLCKSRPSALFYPLAPCLGKRGGALDRFGDSTRLPGRSLGGGMSVSFEELDFRPTPMGVLSLRRRRRPSSDIAVYEIKLGDEFLMSSPFTAAEIELARLGLAALRRGHLDVVV